MSNINPTIMFGLVTMGVSEALRRQFSVAYGAESQQSFCYASLVAGLFVTVYAAFEEGQSC